MLITRNGTKVSTQCLRLSLRVSVGSCRSSFFLHFMTTSIFNNGLTLILLLFLLKQQILI